MLNAQWVFDTPVHSEVETKLRNLLIDLGNADKILGIQVNDLHFLIYLNILIDVISLHYHL